MAVEANNGGLYRGSGVALVVFGQRSVLRLPAARQRCSEACALLEGPSSPSNRIKECGAFARCWECLHGLVWVRPPVVDRIYRGSRGRHWRSRCCGLVPLSLSLSKGKELHFNLRLLSFAVVLPFPGMKPFGKPQTDALRIEVTVGQLSEGYERLEETNLGEASCRNAGGGCSPNRARCERLIVELGDEYRSALVHLKEMEQGAEGIQGEWVGGKVVLRDLSEET
jgi:hypothetical protein